MEDSGSAPWRGWSYDELTNYSCQINIICLLTRRKVFGGDLWRLQQYIGFSNAYNISNAVEVDKNFTWLDLWEKNPQCAARRFVEAWSFSSNSTFEISLLQIHFHEVMCCMWILELFRASIQAGNLPQRTHEIIFLNRVF